MQLLTTLGSFVIYGLVMAVFMYGLAYALAILMFIGCVAVLANLIAGLTKHPTDEG